MSNIFHHFRMLLSRRDKSILLLLVLFSVFLCLIETTSILMVMPFISVATNLSLITSNYYLSLSYRFLGCHTPAHFVVILGCILVVFYTFRSILNIAFIYSLNRFSQGQFHIITFRFFQNYLRCHYREFTKKNSETIRKMIISDANSFTQIISSSSILLSEVFVVLALYTVLFFVNWKMTCVLTLLFFAKFLLLVRPFFKKISKQGKEMGRLILQLHKMFSEAFGNFKLIKFLSNEQYLLERYHCASMRLAHGKSLNMTFQAIPRFLLEMLGFFVLVGVIVYVIYRYNDVTFVLPIVSMYALAFYRLLPSVNKILTNFNQIISAKSSMTLFESDLSETVELLGSEEISFSNSIKLNNVHFGYDPRKLLLRNINLEIQKNQKIAIIGESGCGKSTLVDIISSIYVPQKGFIYIDDILLSKKNMKLWRKKIGYVPQDVYLFDGTVAENVVFGRSYDKKKLISVLVQANIYSYLQTQKGILTKVGENGIQLSGGQKQRIAIARALYSNPDVLILDEATSALDNETEACIMAEIYERIGDKTLIVIAHRLSTISRCDKIYKIENGCMFEINIAANKIREIKHFVARHNV